jgi:HSP20 family protein
MSLYKKSRKQRRQGIRGSKNSRTTLRPKLGDFKRKREENESTELTTNVQDMRPRRRGETRSLHTRHMDGIFDNFRNSIESMLDPSLSSWGYFPSSSRSNMEENEVRTPVYDMSDNGDRYEIIVELPGIDKDNISIKAMDDSIEISAEQYQEEDKQKKNFVYSQRGYSSFYCTIPFPEEILSSEVTAKSDNKGILRLKLPKKTPSRHMVPRNPLLSLFFSLPLQCCF